MSPFPARPASPAVQIAAEQAVAKAVRDASPDEDELEEEPYFLAPFNPRPSLRPPSPGTMFLDEWAACGLWQGRGGWGRSRPCADPETVAATLLGEARYPWMPVRDGGMRVAVRKVRERFEGGQLQRRWQMERRAKIRGRLDAARKAAKAAEEDVQRAAADELQEAARCIQAKFRGRRNARLPGPEEIKQLEAARTIQNMFRRKRAPAPKQPADVSSDGWQWFRGAELPELDIDEVWEMMKTDKASGHILTSLHAEEVIREIRLCLEAFYEVDFAKCLPVQLRGSMSDVSVEPQDLSPQHLAKILQLLLEHPGLSLSAIFVQEALRKVEPDAPMSAFGIDKNTFITLRPFRQLLALVAALTCVDQSILLVELAWQHHKVFRLPTAFAEFCARALIHDGGPAKHQGSAYALGPNNFIRLCNVLNVVEGKDTKPGTKLAVVNVPFLYSPIALKMGKHVLESRSLRPHYEKWAEMERDLRRRGAVLHPSTKHGVSNKARMSDKEARWLAKKTLSRSMEIVLGWTEFGLTMQAVFHKYPGYDLRSPLHMLSQALVRERRRVQPYSIMAGGDDLLAMLRVAFEVDGNSMATVTSFNLHTESSMRRQGIAFPQTKDATPRAKPSRWGTLMLATLSDCSELSSRESRSPSRSPSGCSGSPRRGGGSPRGGSRSPTRLQPPQRLQFLPEGAVGRSEVSEPAAGSGGSTPARRRHGQEPLAEDGLPPTASEPQAALNPGAPAARSPSTP